MNLTNRFMFYLGVAFDVENDLSVIPKDWKG